MISVVGFTGSGSDCRYGEQSTPFCVSVVESCRRRDGEFSRRIHDAVERAGLEVQSGSSSDEEEVSRDKSFSSTSSAPCPAGAEPKTIPTVSNPNSVYRVSSGELVQHRLILETLTALSAPQFSEFSPGAPQTWLREKRKCFGDPFQPHAPPAGGPPSQYSTQKGFKSYRATFTFTGPRIDKYHWVSKTRS